MKRSLFTLLFSIMVLFVHAQTIYKEFEVDSVAHPIGGLPLLEKFVDVNRRMPYAAEVNRTKGAVILSAVVEPNGKISEVNLLRKLQPDCDREAVRVLRLFNAWIPAQKDGKTVRQQITYTVRFVPNGLDCRPGQIIRYYNDKGEFTNDSTKAAYRAISPVDTLGYPNGDAVVYRKSGKKWKEYNRAKLIEESFSHYNYDDPSLPDIVEAYRLRMLDQTGTAQEIEYSFLANGKILAVEPRTDGVSSHSSVYYYQNGAVKHLKEYIDKSKIQEWTWYSNGQLYQIALRDQHVESTTRFQLLSQWDSTGRPTVVQGTGRATYASKSNGRVFQETGAVKNGLKNGEWTGQFNKDQLVYKEVYDNGKFLSGKRYDEKGDGISYDEPEKLPEFKGGLPALGQFLASNLRYPVEASQARIQGKVIIGFVIDTEGNVEDIKVVKSIGYGADEEAVRVVKATSGNWAPGMKRGQAIKVRHSLPINFALQ